MSRLVMSFSISINLVRIFNVLNDGMIPSLDYKFTLLQNARQSRMAAPARLKLFPLSIIIAALRLGFRRR